MNAIQNTKGSSFLILILVLSLIPIISLLATQDLLIHSAKTSKTSQLSYKISTQIIRNNIVALLRNPVIFNQTVLKNSTMSCLANHTDCPLAPTPISQLQIDGESLVDSNNVNFGYNVHGDTCTQYSNPGDLLCVYQVTLNWRPDCSASPCINPKVIVSIKLTVKPAFLEANIINESKLNFEDAL